MHTHSCILRLLAFIALILLPIEAAANTLTITDVDTPEEGSPTAEAELSVYFDLRQGENMMPVTGINADNCKVLVDGKTPPVLKSELLEFSEGNKGIGVLFIFPIAKNYDEEAFQIRANLVTLVQSINRDIDYVNAIPYDSANTQIGWSKASDGSLSRALTELKTTDALEPNLFNTFRTAISAFENLHNVSQKYVVIISDAEGAIVGNPERANQFIGTFSDQLKKAQITPIIIGYSPDGAQAMSNVGLIRRIATNVGGPYYQAESVSAYQQIIQSDVKNYIYKQYIYRATLDMSGDYYLEQGKYNLQLVVKTSNSEDKAGYKLKWPVLKKSKLWLWLLLGGIFILGIGATVIIIVRRNNDDEEEFVDEGPKEVCCATCGKVIPQQLFGFNGEFCLSGGLPDCPYYQMPDRGKIQITRGPLADTTFFIKNDMTTIGSYPENHIYLADKSVSRKHAAIKADEGKRYEIRDFGSSNGLYINNEKVERKFLRDGDLIRFGTVETVFKLK